MQLYLQAYQSFISGRHVSEGIRVTIGIILPALVGSYFGELGSGLIMSLGALCINVPDSPGPFHHRRNAMSVTLVIIFFVALLMGYAADSRFLLGVIIVVMGFLFSMLNIYGTRVAAIGIAALLVMILSIENVNTTTGIWAYALYIFLGGLWMMCYSLMVHKIMPYRIIRQVLGDLIINNATYLRTRALFYEDDPDYEKIYRLLLDQQIKLEAEQSLLSEMIFKTRTIVKESTNTSRLLLKNYLDINELHENIMTSFQDYDKLHEAFNDTGILPKFKQHLIRLSDELEQIGIYVKSEMQVPPNLKNIEKLDLLKDEFKTLRLTKLSDKNIENFVGLGRILNNLQYLTERIQSLYFYTNKKAKINKGNVNPDEVQMSLPTKDIRPAIFFNNLNFKSNIFRHSLRVSLALLTGYYLASLLNLGHSYWLLLTIVVILKPAYSLTKKRNIDRLLGTFLGIFVGVLLLNFIIDHRFLMVVMLIFMGFSYVFIRTNYLWSVITMTPYLVIFFYLLYPADLNVLLYDRLVDTAIGSVISFIASLFFIPNWEHENIKKLMTTMLESGKLYFSKLADGYHTDTETSPREFKALRKELLVSLANVSDAFTRMLSEPKRFQKGVKSVHRFVVLNHILASHFATLSYYLNVHKNAFRAPEILPVKNQTLRFYNNAILVLDQKKPEAEPEREPLEKLNELVKLLLDKRKQEILAHDLETATKKELIEVKSVVDQFNLIFSVSSDIYKCVGKMDR